MNPASHNIKPDHQTALAQHWANAGETGGMLGRRGPITADAIRRLVAC